MKKKISYSARQELLLSVHKKYQNSTRKEKTKILEMLISATGYDRKHLLKLMNKTAEKITSNKSLSGRKKVYTDETIKNLKIIWEASNEICSKRLVPFIPDMMDALQRHGHLKVSDASKDQLLLISSSTVDRLLKPYRTTKKKRGLCTTTAGTLLKNSIKIRTFADWNDIEIGYFEGDLVAHCGETVMGQFLNTLVITDISTSWTELIAILKKGSSEVKHGLQEAMKVIPFKVLGLDFDNGSEFINHEIFDFCEEEKINFTRSRPYKKNDQAHVEERNGSIVRKIIGYDRYEGEEALQALTKLYSVLRLYVNYFQPSLKLEIKKRINSKVIKKYEAAQTPFQRLINSPYFTTKEKDDLTLYYLSLDPIDIKSKIADLQNKFWALAWTSEITAAPVPMNKDDKLTRNYIEKSNNMFKTNMIFDSVKEEIIHEITFNLKKSCKDILIELIKKYPNTYHLGQLRQLQRVVKKLKENHIQPIEESNKILPENQK